MHVAPAEFRSARRDGVTLHFAALADMAWVVAEFPASGSHGTFAEEWCQRSHRAIALTGDIELDLDGERQEIGPGSVLYVPASIRHRFVASPGARMAGFEPLAPDVRIDDESLRQAGYEVGRAAVGAAKAAVAVVHPRPARSPAAGEIVAEADLMGDFVLARTRFGRRAGYTSELCDVPHWGLVTMGSIAIEWENDVEVVGAGDVFHCPGGPPGHRLQAAEPAAIVDFTPVAATNGGLRLVAWRQRAIDQALTAVRDGRPIQVAALG